MTDLDDIPVKSTIGTMPKPPLFDYNLLLLSGLPIYVQNGTDYTVPTEQVRWAVHKAARQRGLRVVTRVVLEYDGIIFQAYLPGNDRPVLPAPPVADFKKETYKFLFCLIDGCENRLRPQDQVSGLCERHQS